MPKPQPAKHRSATRMPPHLPAPHLPSLRRSGSSTGPRLAPLEPAQRTEEQRELLSPVLGEEAPNLFSTVVQHPELYRAWLPFCLHLLTSSAFPDRERELLIIRTAALCCSAYELEHHLNLGAAVGLTEHELAALTGKAKETWSPRDRLLVTAAEELHAHHVISDATWRGLSEQLTTEQLVELPMLAGHYVLLAGLLRSLGVPLDSEQAESNTTQ
jgi:alkylhydroperoxidase family enzyme